MGEKYWSRRSTESGHVMDQKEKGSSRAFGGIGDLAAARKGQVNDSFPGAMTNYSKLPTWADKEKTAIRSTFSSFMMRRSIQVSCSGTFRWACLKSSSRRRASGNRNDRVFDVPDRSPFEGDLQDIRRLPARAIKELKEFFLATNALEAKTLKFLGWRGPAKAIKTIKKTSI
jgi:hypothetical protein